MALMAERLEDMPDMFMPDMVYIDIPEDTLGNPENMLEPESTVMLVYATEG